MFKTTSDGKKWIIFNNALAWWACCIYRASKRGYPVLHLFLLDRGQSRRSSHETMAG